MCFLLGEQRSAQGCGVERTCIHSYSAFVSKSVGFRGFSLLGFHVKTLRQFIILFVFLFSLSEPKSPLSSTLVFLSICRQHVPLYRSFLYNSLLVFNKSKLHLSRHIYQQFYPMIWFPIFKRTFGKYTSVPLILHKN